ncbi:azurin [Cryomorpha ignava]|uniref:Azurin n=1 Tax=Cryomorpha ignava TaxID=101383 RepID=A0A7K3WT64_9FLAO|nr:azurin [Cryomorpha ignava]NEN24241.1 azurin [Cryomorpha ignava]
MKQIVIILASALMLVSCGGGEQNTDSTMDNTPATESKSDEVMDEAPEAVTLTIEGNDEMKYNKDMLSVKAGQEVTLVLKHVGKMDKAAMGHNWTLLKKGVDMQEFAIEAIAAKDSEYIPVGTNKVITHTAMIGGGEETSITFTAPAKGKYQFLCTFPGHFAAMNGTFMVE